MTQGEAHWSKDFVEHLRTVHFSLIILCVGLLIVTNTERDTTARRAKAQLDQINTVASQISASAFDRYCQERRRAPRSPVVDEPAGSNKIDLSQPLILKTTHPERRSETVYFRIEPECSLQDIQPITADNAKIPGARVGGLLYTTLQQESGRKHLMDVLRQRPQTLADFVAEWELLNHRLFLTIPTSLDAQIGAVTSSSVADEPDGIGKPDRRYKLYTPDQLGPIEAQSGLPMEMFVAPAKPYAGDRADIGRSFPENLFFYVGPGGYVRIKSFATVPLDGFFYLVDRLPESQRTSWRQGTFAEAFPDLNTITKDRQAASFKVWDQALRDEIDRTSDSFEAFGLKIPAQATTLWGLALILGVQLYMLTHLIELTRKIDIADPGWEVAWIGIYQHRLARIIFFASAIVLPPLTVLLIAHKGVALTVDTTRSAVIQTWGTMIVGGLISGIIALITSGRLPQRGAAPSVAAPATSAPASAGAIDAAPTTASDAPAPPEI